MRKFLLVLVALLGVGAAIALAAPAQAATGSTPYIKRLDTNLETFYPTVRDGYRDGVTFSGRAAFIEYEDESGDWITDDRQSWNVTVRNSNGSKVAERSGNSAEWGLRWYWNGKSQRTGEPVRVGKYKATLTVTNEETGETRTATKTVTATTDTVDRRMTLSRSGTNTSSRSHSGSCYFSGFYGSLDLDCWGGRQAVANYRFNVPNNARNVTWNVRGDRGCCDNGQVVKTGTRTGDHFNVRVRVTNWAAYTVDRASVTYTTTVRR